MKDRQHRPCPFKVGDRVRHGTSSDPSTSVYVVDHVGVDYLVMVGEVHGNMGFVPWRNYDRYEVVPAAPPVKPAYLNGLWVNVYESYTSGVGDVADRDRSAYDNRIGRLNLGTGEWVPCNGRTVLSSDRLTRVTAVDVDSGESETCEFGPTSYVLICGGDRFLASEQHHANGTTVLTVKTYKEGGDYR